MPVIGGFDEVDIEEWQESNGYLYDGVSFYWEVERNDSTEDLDLSFGSHQGVECIVLN